ncbi:MAG: hypothetical protein WDM81_04295 [Rhizomicrobium sp.]
MKKLLLASVAAFALAVTPALAQRHDVAAAIRRRRRRGHAGGGGGGGHAGGGGGQHGGGGGGGGAHGGGANNNGGGHAGGAANPLIGGGNPGAAMLRRSWRRRSAWRRQWWRPAWRRSRRWRSRRPAWRRQPGEYLRHWRSRFPERQQFCHGHNNAFNSLRRAFNATRRFRAGSYHRPSGYYYRRWNYGDYLPALFFAQSFWLQDYDDYDLSDPPPGTVGALRQRRAAGRPGQRRSHPGGVRDILLNPIPPSPLRGRGPLATRRSRP